MKRWIPEGPAERRLLLAVSIAAIFFLLSPSIAHFVSSTVRVRYSQVGYETFEATAAQSGTPTNRTSFESRFGGTPEGRRYLESMLRTVEMLPPDIVSRISLREEELINSFGRQNSAYDVLRREILSLLEFSNSDWRTKFEIEELTTYVKDLNRMISRIDLLVEVPPDQSDIPIPLNTVHSGPLSTHYSAYTLYSYIADWAFPAALVFALDRGDHKRAWELIINYYSLIQAMRRNELSPWGINAAYSVEVKWAGIVEQMIRRRPPDPIMAQRLIDLFDPNIAQSEAEAIFIADLIRRDEAINSALEGHSPEERTFSLRDEGKISDPALWTMRLHLMEFINLAPALVRNDTTKLENSESRDIFYSNAAYSVLRHRNPHQLISDMHSAILMKSFFRTALLLHLESIRNAGDFDRMPKTMDELYKRHNLPLPPDPIAGDPNETIRFTIDATKKEFVIESAPGPLGVPVTMKIPYGRSAR